MARGEIERVDVGDPAGAIDDAIGLCRMLGAVMCKDHAQSSVCRLDPLDVHSRPDANADALAFGLKPRYCVRVHRGQQPRQRFENHDICAGARIDICEFERDHTATNENH